MLRPQVKLDFTDNALTAIAVKAINKGTGARGLRAILVSGVGVALISHTPNYINYR